MSSETASRDWSWRSHRGQSVLIGVILLFGIVAVGSIGIFLLAGQSVDGIEQQAENERVETAFIELNQDLETATYSSDTNTLGTVTAGEHGDVEKRADGWMNITTPDSSTNEINIQLGSVVYEGADGQTVAYQGGGVWRGTGSETQMVSAPPIHYRDGSVTLPVTSVSGDETLHAGRVEMSHNETTSYEELSFVNDEVVEIEITSEYYIGWKEYFIDQAGESVVKEVDDGDNTVVIILGRGDIHDGFLDRAATLPGEMSDGGGSSSLDGEYVAKNCGGDSNCTEYDDGTYGSTSLDRQIEKIINQSGPDIDPAGRTLTSGTYLVEDDLMLDNQNITVDVGDGDVTLALDGDLSVKDQHINVVNGSGPDSGTFRIYSNESIGLGNEAEINGAGNVSDTEIYGTSTMNVSVGQECVIGGSVYAPREETPNNGKNTAAVPMSQSPDCDDYDVCIDKGGARIYGTVVAGSMNLGNGDNKVVYDSDVAEADITVKPDGYVFPPGVSHLNVVEHDITVTND